MIKKAMKANFQKMMRDQIQSDLDNPAELLHKPLPKGGWIKIMRQALGMTTYQLAKRLNRTQSNIIAMERREKAGTISLDSLDAAAKAMHCRLIYFFVPEKSLNETLKDQAVLIAKNRLRAIEHSMELEQQGLTSIQKKQQEQELIQELLRGNPKILWRSEEMADLHV